MIAKYNLFIIRKQKLLYENRFRTQSYYFFNSVPCSMYHILAYLYTLIIQLKQNILIRIILMTSNDLTVDSIIKKYQQRQEQLSYSAMGSKLQQIDTSGEINMSVKYATSGVQTPQFSNFTKRKEKKISHETNVHKTHKKRDSSHTHSRAMSNQQSFELQHMRRDYDLTVKRLQKTEQQLQTYEKNYTEMWKKYEILLKEGKKSTHSIELQQKLRQRQVMDLKDRINVYQRQIQNLKECVDAKESNLTALKEKLKEKNERIIQADRLIESVNTQLQMLRVKQARDQDIEDSKNFETNSLIEQLKSQISRQEKLSKQKDQEKKQLFLELEKNYRTHKEELEMLRLTFKKVEAQYKEWIDNAQNEKHKMVQDYDKMIKESHKIAAALSSSSQSADQLQKQLINKNEEIENLMTENTKLISEIKSMKSQMNNIERAKQDLIVKISTLQNSMIQKVDYQRVRQEALTKAQGLYRAEEEKNKEISSKYNLLNAQFQDLKNKCSTMFSELEDRKESKDSQGLEIIRLRKDILHCKEQLQKCKNNQMSLTARLNETVTTLKKKTKAFEDQKQQLTTDLFAQRLEKARLKEQLHDTKTKLKKQYDLSIQNTKKELEQKIKVHSTRPASVSGSHVQKEQMYLQMRELERRYELLASQMVTMDDVMGIAAKMQKRYQPVR